MKNPRLTIAFAIMTLGMLVILSVQASRWVSLGNEIRETQEHRLTPSEQAGIAFGGKESQTAKVNRLFKDRTDSLVLIMGMLIGTALCGVGVLVNARRWD